VNCKEFLDLLIPITTEDEFDIDSKTEAAFKQHYLECDACWKKYEAQLKVLGALEDLVTEKQSKRLLYKAMALKKDGKHEEAIQAFEEVLELDADNDLAKSMLASLYRETGRSLEEIPADYKHAVVMALTGTASNHIENREYSEAVSCYMKALEFLPDEWSLWLSLGSAYLYAEEWELAKDAFEKANSLKQDDYQIISHLGSVYFELGEKEKGLQLLEQANTLKPKIPFIMNNLAHVKMDSGGTHVALALLQKVEIAMQDSDAPAEMKNRDTATVQNNLAMLYWQIGDKSNAEGYINSAINIDPDNETIKHNFDIITGEADGKLLYLMLQ